MVQREAVVIEHDDGTGAEMRPKEFRRRDFWGDAVHVDAEKGYFSDVDERLRHRTSDEFHERLGCKLPLHVTKAFLVLINWRNCFPFFSAQLIGIKAGKGVEEKVVFVQAPEIGVTNDCAGKTAATALRRFSSTSSRLSSEPRLQFRLAKMPVETPPRRPKKPWGTSPSLLLRKISIVSSLSVIGVLMQPDLN